MPSTFSPSLRIELIGEGEQSGIWGNTTNTNLGNLVEQAITGTTNLDVTAGNITLTSLNGLVDQARSSVLSVTGTPGATRVITIPNVNKNYTVQNSTANIVQIKTTSGTAFDCPPLSHSYISCNGSNVVVGRSITNGANTLTSSAAPFNSPTFTGVPIAPTASVGTNTTQLATTAYAFAAAAAAAFPVGGIILWSGSIASVPSGWALCDGTLGTPNLRDRFIVGAGSTYAVGNTGGANTVTLDTTQIPSHTHTGSGTTASVNLAHTHTGTTSTADLSHVHNVNGTTSGQSANHVHSYSGTTSGIGDHAHSYDTLVGADSYGAAAEYGASPGTQSTGNAGAHSHTYGGDTTGVNANHDHTLNVNSAGMSANSTHNHTMTTGAMSANADHTHTFSFTSASTGGGLAHENRPPYYALAYIMKV